MAGRPAAGIAAAAAAAAAENDAQAGDGRTSDAGQTADTAAAAHLAQAAHAEAAPSANFASADSDSDSDTDTAGVDGWLAGGWLADACRRPSPNFGPRPPQARVTLALVHSISLPPGIYGGDDIERLFMNRLDWDEHPYFQSIRGLEVSSHFLIRRDGRLLQFVGCDERAWHAGRSCWRGREGCNDFSVGIELEGLEGGAFEDAQYDELATLLGAAEGALPDRRRGRPRACGARPQARSGAGLRLAAAAAEDALAAAVFSLADGSEAGCAGAANSVPEALLHEEKTACRASLEGRFDAGTDQWLGHYS